MLAVPINLLHCVQLAAQHLHLFTSFSLFISPSLTLLSHLLLIMTNFAVICAVAVKQLTQTRVSCSVHKLIENLPKFSDRAMLLLFIINCFLRERDSLLQISSRSPSHLLLLPVCGIIMIMVMIIIIIIAGEVCRCSLKRRCNAVRVNELTD